METQQQRKATVVALFLFAAGYTPGASASTLAEATPTRETLQSKQC
jgi:hypothetical protein